MNHDSIVDCWKLLAEKRKRACRLYENKMFKCPCCVKGSGSTAWNLWRHHLGHFECPSDCAYHKQYPRNPPPTDPVVAQLMQDVGNLFFFFCSLFFYAALQNATLTALLEQPVTPLELKVPVLLLSICRDIILGCTPIAHLIVLIIWNIQEFLRRWIPW
jgi:hypothetical protein